MWGFPVLLGIAVALPLLPFRSSTLRDAWLVCGVLSSFLYVAMNIVVPMQWPGFDSASQVVSELSAVGAPTRPLWVVLGMAYTLLVTVFGWGVVMAAEDNRRLRVAGILIVIYGAMGVVWPFAPMHLREALAVGGGDFRDTMHIAFGVATEVIYLLALGFAGAALGRAFRIYSIATFVALLAFGVLTFRDAPRLSAQSPHPAHRRLGANQHRRLPAVGHRAGDRAAPPRAPEPPARAAAPASTGMSVAECRRRGGTQRACRSCFQACNTRWT